MVDRARERAADPLSAEFVVGDSECPLFRDAEFTAILCTASFHHYPDPARALAEMARVLAVDGRLVLADATADLRLARAVDWFLRRFEIRARLAVRDGKTPPVSEASRGSWRSWAWSGSRR